MARRVIWLSATIALCIGGATSQDGWKQTTRNGSSPSIAMTKANGFDPLGVWYAGVEALSQKQPSIARVKAAKKKNIGIVGAGMSGLMTYLVLHEAGFKNLTILEAGDRLGGRVHTTYLTGGPSDYSYQELGAMRLPVDYVDQNDTSHNISDTQLVLFLIDQMNKRNKGDPKLRVDLIPWIDQNDNGLQYFHGIRTPSGLPPTVHQISKNKSLTVPVVLDAETRATSKKLDENLPDDDFMIAMAKNMYKAHREWVDGGLGGQPGDRWSEFSYISQYLKGSLNSTDILDNQVDPQGSFWEYVYDVMYESAEEYKAVDGGFSRIPQSFGPLVSDHIQMGAKVERVKYSKKKVTLQWKRSFKDPKFQDSTFDYAIIAVPFTVVRQWRLPEIGVTMANGIKNLIYDTSCKLVLEYSERFWEKYENPIFGGCSTQTDIPGIAFVCYPSYNLNGTGPATILASYLEGSVNHEMARMVAMSDEEHAMYALDAMTEIHGEHTRQLFTGKYVRKCWGLDPLTAGAWANPSAGQQELYIPEYFKVHKHLIFVGEHTSYTHGWISSALDSGIRGGVQMLLELGLVDEAKAAVKKWLVRKLKFGVPISDVAKSTCDEAASCAIGQLCTRAPLLCEFLQTLTPIVMSSHRPKHFAFDATQCHRPTEPTKPGTDTGPPILGHLDSPTCSRQLAGDISSLSRITLQSPPLTQRAPWSGSWINYMAMAWQLGLDGLMSACQSRGFFSALL